MRIVVLLSLATLLGGGAVALGVWVGLGRPIEIAETVTTVSAAETPHVPSSAPKAAPVASAQGRVEGRTENIDVEASADGRIKTLLVKEGQKLEKDQVIATLACENLDSEVRALEAIIEIARQSRARLMRGSREEERQIAAENVRNSQILLVQARRENERMQLLVSQDGVPQQTAEAAKRDFDSAESGWKSALEKQKLTNAAPLPEDVAKADAEVVAAEQKLSTAVALRDKCVVKSPMAGTVVHVHLNVGEAVSTLVPRPIVTMADLSARRIRAEVDERDVAKVHLNQRVRISAEGLPETFGGTIIWKSEVMGRKTARSADPAERSDRDILETLIAPDKGSPAAPVGLRVAVEFLRD